MTRKNPSVNKSKSSPTPKIKKPEKTNTNTRTKVHKLDLNRIQEYFIILVLGLIIGWVVWLFNRAFLTSLAIGCITAVFTYPVYKNILDFIQKRTKFLSEGVAAIITIVMLSTIVGISFNLFLGGLRRELPKFQQGISNFITNLPENNTLKGVLGVDDNEAENLAYTIDQEIQEFGSFLADRDELFRQLFNSENISATLQFGQRTVTQLFNILIDFIIFFLTWSMLLINGKRWLDRFYELIPLNQNEKQTLTNDFREGVRNVAYASLTSTLVHTTAISMILWGFDIQSKFIILAFVILISVLPLSPAELAYAVPISLVFVENPVAALVLIPIAEILILWVNYILIPRIIASSDNGNPLLIITSILSGIAIFGVMGFIIGPVLMVFVASLYKILRQRLKKLNS